MDLINDADSERIVSLCQSIANDRTGAALELVEIWKEQDALLARLNRSLSVLMAQRQHDPEFIANAREESNRCAERGLILGDLATAAQTTLH